MKKLIGWQIYTVALMAIGYAVSLQLGQGAASLMGVTALFLSLCMLVVSGASGGAYSAFFGAILAALLSLFAHVSASTPDVIFAIACLLVFVSAVVVSLCSILGSVLREPNKPELNFFAVLLTYLTQGGLVSAIILH